MTVRLFVVFAPLLGLFITFISNGSTKLLGVGQRVLDGDTLIVGGRVVRLAFIDAPELKQRSRWGVPVGRESREFLERLVRGQPLRVDLLGRGHYGRWMGRVWILRGDGGEPLDVNLSMVEEGHAFVLAFFQKAPGGFHSAQQVARAKGRGMWGYEGVRFPWAYRRKLR